jgi:site-specific DNA-methyltransferase (adenine-specific)
MKPYFERDRVAIYHGDCREVLPTLGNLGTVVTDPPYGETSLDWDVLVRGWMAACEAGTNSIWCFGSFRMFMAMARTGEWTAWRHAQEIVWEKQNGSGFQNDRFKRVHELAVHFYRGEWGAVFKAPVFTPDATAKVVRRKKRPTHMGDIGSGAFVSHDGGPRLMRSVIYAANCHGYADHPTQKPLAVIDPLLRYSVPPGGLVTDPFMGSGSTLVAARNLGLSAVGIDTDERCCEIAAKRLSQGVLALEPAPCHHPLTPSLIS